MTTFYSELAADVTSILTELGQSVTLKRGSSAFDPVGGRDISESITSLSAKGVWQTIAARLVDGSRIRVGDKFLLINAAVAPRMGDKVDGWSVVEINEINPAGTALAYRLVMRK